MAALPLEERATLERDIGALQTALRAGLSLGRQTSAASYLDIWVNFCQQLGLDPYMAQGPDAVCWLSIFAARV
jgi:hypothetical protein